MKTPITDPASARRRGLAVAAVLALCASVGPVAATSAQATTPLTPIAYEPRGTLLDVQAFGSDDAWVVGERPRDHNRESAASVSNWDGTGWHVQYLDRTHYSDLEGVDALSSDDMWAVGTTTPQSHAQPLIEHWDGSTWTGFATTNPPQDGRLSAVKALSGDDAWAVGFARKRALIEHWNGAKWSQVKNPVTGWLGAVDGVSPTDVWAAGSRYDHGYWRPVVEHYDGQQWTQDKSFVDVDPRGTTYPTGVYASASNDVWVVGYSQKPEGGRLHALLEHWDGSTWTVVPGPPGDAMLLAVDGTSANDIWAVGAHGLYYGLALHWDGTRWTRNYTGKGFPPLEAVSADSSTDAWAIWNGDRFAGVAHYNGLHWTFG